MIRNKGILYWITGLSGAGKTTIGNALYYKLKEQREGVVLLDGDILKQVVGEDLGYTLGDRKKRAIRYSKLCKTLVDQGIAVICCTIAMFDEVREWNRDNIDGYMEVFLNVPMEVLISRDRKGMYSKSIEGKFNNLVGIDMETEFPKNPDISLLNDGTRSVKDCVDEILNTEIAYKTDDNRDQEYWNQFYAGQFEVSEPSPFARDMAKHLKTNKKILDLGCGNGRDSIYFMEQGLRVTGIDRSQSAIEKLNNRYGKDQRGIFICDDFIKSKALFQEQYDYCYSRFTIHALNEKQQDELLNNVYTALKDNGKFLIEVRCIKDDLFGKGIEVERNAFLYEGHYRRFVVKEELENLLRTKGFFVEQSVEAAGFAPFKDRDPVVLRMIASKKSTDGVD